ncbi:unnamed protein product [Lupinus luteus]|uniref:DUF4283 domain-containing protein n=1 Tax=Lupinus luteus TaxID=3873 RepID=A0AAV1VSB9_LUPLU
MEPETLLKGNQCEVDHVLPSKYLVPRSKEALNSKVRDDRSYANAMRGVGVIARPLGGKKVLLAPKDGECVKEVMFDALVWSTNLFLSLSSWTDDCVEAGRLVWIRCFGLPIHVWNEESFSLLAKEFGSLLEVDKASSLKECLEYCRLMIRTSSWSRIEDDIGACISGKEYTIHIMEDWGGALCCVGKNVIGGSSYVSDSYGGESDRGWGSIPQWLSECAMENMGEEGRAMAGGEGEDRGRLMVDERDDINAVNVSDSPRGGFLVRNFNSGPMAGGDHLEREGGTGASDSIIGNVPVLMREKKCAGVESMVFQFSLGDPPDSARVKGMEVEAVVSQGGPTTLFSTLSAPCSLENRGVSVKSTLLLDCMDDLLGLVERPDTIIDDSVQAQAVVESSFGPACEFSVVIPILGSARTASTGTNHVSL